MRTHHMLLEIRACLGYILVVCFTCALTTAFGLVHVLYMSIVRDSLFVSIVKLNVVNRKSATYIYIYIHLSYVQSSFFVHIIHVKNHIIIFIIIYDTAYLIRFGHLFITIRFSRFRPGRPRRSNRRWTKTRRSSCWTQSDRTPSISAWRNCHLPGPLRRPSWKWMLPSWTERASRYAIITPLHTFVLPPSLFTP